MGGSAFSNPSNPAESLLTPRMPVHVYLYMRERCLRILRTLYQQAECPIEAPAKADFGDVDILVASPNTPADTDIASIAAALGATKYKQNSPTTNFALPWPTAEEICGEVSSASTEDSSAYHGRTTPGSVGTPRYIQLDLHVCSTLEDFEWALFHQAHGDLWNIFGGMIRSYGLVVNHTGLHLRLAGVGDIAKERRTIALTSSPSAVLRFLGLDEKSYWTPFDSVDAMFAYAASCRFFNPKAYERKEDLKANDRLRMKKRPIFLQWYEGYMRQHKGDAPGRSAGMGGEEVIEDAKRVFGVQKEYEEKRAKGLWAMRESRFWSDIRTGLPVERLRIGVVIRGVKREVMGKLLTENLENPSSDKAEMVKSKLRYDGGEFSDMQHAYIDGRFDEIAAWVKADWESIEGRQIAHERRQSTKHLLAKIEKDKAKMETGESQSASGTEPAD